MAENRTFRGRVLDVVAKIPKGKTMAYGEVARRAGSPGAARAAGSIMKANRDPKIPCHRVICSDSTGESITVEDRRRSAHFLRKKA